MKNLKLFSILLMIFILACSNDKKEKVLDLTKLQGEYLGQAYPEKESEVFLDGLVDQKHSLQNILFSKNGNDFYYTRTTLDNDSSKIFLSKQINNVWTKAKLLDFIDANNYTDPFLSPDQIKLFFVTDKPKPGIKDSLYDYNIWVSSKENNKWNIPIYIDEINSNEDEYYPSIAKNMNLYFSSARNNSKGFWDIYKSVYKKGKFSEPTRLNAPINSDSRDWDPFIAPDESYLLFASDRPGGFGGGDIYISFKNKQGNWGTPKNLGKYINTNEYEYCPKVSPDGKYLFFTRLISKSENYYQGKGADKRDPFKYIYFPENGRGVIYWAAIDSLAAFNN